MKNFAVLGGEKTKPIQSQFKAKQACPERSRMEPIASLWPEILSTKL